MIGSGWWSTGISVAWTYAGSGDYGWAAELTYLDSGFVNDDADSGRVSTQGTLYTRYAVRQGDTADALTVVLDVLKADAERLGIEWRRPSLFYKGDGESKDYPPPEGWRQTLAMQADRLGWDTYIRLERSDKEESGKP